MSDDQFRSPVLDIDKKYLHPYCIQCIKENTTKHAIKDEDGTVIVPKGVFPINCRGILNEEAYKNLAEGDEGQYEIIRSALDPAYWAKKNLGWKPRVAKKEYGKIPYQEVLVNCTADRKVYRLGRRLGKCFYSQSVIGTSGGIYTWEELYHSDTRPSIRTLDLIRNTSYLVDNYEIFDNGIKEVYHVQTSNGLSEYVTANHPFLVLVDNGWKWIEAKDLLVGMEVLENLPAGLFGSEVIGTGQSRLLGYVFASKHRSIAEQSLEYEDLIKTYGYSFVKSLYEDPYPTVIYKLCEEDLLAFVQAVTKVLGRFQVIYTKKKRRGGKFIYYFDDHMAAKGFQLTLGQFGIYSSIDDTKLIINDKVSLIKLMAIAQDHFADVGKMFNIDTFDHGLFGRGYRSSTVSSIVSIGEGQTYGVYVPETNVISGFVVTHNTEAISIEIMHDLFTSAYSSDYEQNTDDTVITPSQSQRDEIINRIRTFMYDRLGIDKSDLEKDKNTPFPIIKTRHKTSVKGLVTGTTPGSQATSIRSQGGDKLVLDEAAFFSEDHYAAFLALLSDHPDVRMVVSSTPKGKSSVFYKWCHDPTYKEFHFPSIISPLWTPRIERELKKFYGPINYKAEILAEFIDEDESAFPDVYIESLFSLDESYVELTANILNDREKYYIGMGVDWNGSTNGTQIYIIAADRKTNKKTVIWKDAVHDEEQTQLKSVIKIRDLNRKYRPDFIYIDIGFGHTQYELLRTMGLDALRKYGANHPDSKLLKITPIMANKTIEVTDPVRKDIKRTIAVKPFMVEVTLMEMEKKNILAPNDDDQLKEQMKHYHLVKISSTGIPIYKASNRRIGDHALDAFLLCNLGFRLEYESKDLKTDLVNESVQTVDPYIEILINPANYDNEDELQEKKTYSTIKRRKPFKRTVSISDKGNENQGRFRPGLPVYKPLRRLTGSKRR